MNVTFENGIPEVTPENLFAVLDPSSGDVTTSAHAPGAKENPILIDVRRPEEYTGELGHIEGAALITLGPELQQWLDDGLKNGTSDSSIVFVCRSGARSGNATQYAASIGYKSVANMTGGMIRWNELSYPVVR